MTEKRTFTLTEDNQLIESISNRTGSLKACFMEFARQTGHPVKSVSNHYYSKLKPSMNVSFMANATPLAENEETSTRTFRKWTDEEDRILLEHLKVGTGNFHACFLAVAEEIDRTPTAIAAHWYAVLSKRTDLPPVVVTASENQVQRNRKNGKGVESNPSIWRRLLAVLRSLHIS